MDILLVVEAVAAVVVVARVELFPGIEHNEDMVYTGVDLSTRSMAKERRGEKEEAKRLD